MDKNIQAEIKTTLWQKITLVIFSILLTFALLEIGLRLGGFVILSFQQVRNIAHIKQPGQYRILCLGESTTQGQYPKFLEEVLNKRNIGIKFSVIDEGRANTNTVAILNRVESLLEKYHPNMVITMMGINDAGAHIPYENPSSSQVILFLKSLKTYKLGRLLWLHMATMTKEIKLSNLINKQVIGKNNANNKKDTSDNLNNNSDYFRLGWECRIQGKLQQAEEYFNKLLALNSNKYGAYYGFGWICYDQGKLQQAEEYFKKASKLAPRNEGAWLGLGWLYFHQDKFHQVEGYFIKVLELNHKNNDAWFGLVSLYHKQGKIRQAAEVCKKILELNPNNHQDFVNFRAFS